MVIYKVFYRTAQLTDDNGDPVGTPGSWTVGADIDTSKDLPQTFPIGSLTNGTTYEFVAGRADNGSLARELSSIRRATPNGLGEQTVGSGGLTKYDRQAPNTTLTMSSANWIHVYLDYVDPQLVPRSAGVRQIGSAPALPPEYPANTDLIARTSPTEVVIKLPSTQAFKFTVVSKNSNLTINLSAVS